MRDPPRRVIVKIRIVFIRRQLEVTAGHMAGTRHVSPARVEPAAGISLCPGSQAALPPCFLTSSTALQPGSGSWCFQRSGVRTRLTCLQSRPRPTRCQCRCRARGHVRTRVEEGHVRPAASGRARAGAGCRAQARPGPGGRPAPWPGEIQHLGFNLNI